MDRRRDARMGDVTMDTLRRISILGEPFVALPVLPDARVVVTPCELAAEPELRSLLLGRWAARLEVGNEDMGRPAAGLALLSDVASRIAAPLVAAHVACDRVPQVDADTVLLAFGSCAPVVAVTLRPLHTAVLPSDPLGAADGATDVGSRAALRQALRDALVATTAPLVDGIVAGLGIAAEIGWGVVVDAAADAYLEVGRRTGDPPRAGAEAALVFDGRTAPLTGRANIITVAHAGSIELQRVRNACCHLPRSVDECPGCPRREAFAPGRPLVWQGTEPGPR